MKNKRLKEKIEEIFKKDERFWDDERKVLLRNTISDYAEKFDEKFLEMLLSDKTAKEHFFKKVGKMMVFDKDKFLAYINNKDFLENSYTKFTFLHKIYSKYRVDRRGAIFKISWKSCFALAL